MEGILCNKLLKERDPYFAYFQSIFTILDLISFRENLSFKLSKNSYISKLKR